MMAALHPLFVTAGGNSGDRVYVWVSV